MESKIKNENINYLQKQIEEFQKKLLDYNNLKENILSKDKKIICLTDENKDFQIKINNYKKKLEEQNILIEKLKNKYEEIQKVIKNNNNIQIKLKEKEEEFQILKVENEELQKLIEINRSENNQLKKEKKELEVNFRRIEEIKNKNEIEINNLKEEIEELKKGKSILFEENNPFNNKSQRKTEKFLNKAFLDNGNVGLENLGNTCYMNSFLQITKTIFHLVKYITLNDFKSISSNLINSYQETLFHLLSSHKNYVYSPQNFREAIGQKNPSFKSYQQNDSTNLMSEFIVHLTKDLNNKDNNYKNYMNLNMSDDEDTENQEKFNRAVRKLFKQRNNYLTSIFYFITKSTNICSICGKKSISFSHDNFINCPIKINEKKFSSLVECITNYQNTKTIQDICENCKKKCQHNKTYEIYTLPKVLFINLKRVSENTLLSHKVVFDNKLNFSSLIKNEKYKNYIYDLTGIIMHIGSANGGHRYAYTKNFFDNNWHKCDDSSVSTVNEDDIKEYSKAFLFVFQINEKNDEDLKKIAQKCDDYSK